MRVEVRLRGELPSASDAHDAGRRLGQRLLLHRGVPSCRVTVNANRHRVLSWRLEPTPELSVHWALAPYPDEVMAVLDGDRAAWSRLRAKLPSLEPTVEDLGPSTGEVHDLAALLAAQRAHLPRAPEVPVSWGRWPTVAPRRVLRLGSCSTGAEPVIRIHPVLDHAEVPDWFVGFILFHELLHVVFPPVPGSGRRVVHPRSFRAAERRHPDHARALAWERTHVLTLMRRCASRLRGR